MILHTLRRRKPSGFVLWPKDWPHRILCGKARFQTKCDMIIGPCSCGYTHRESDGDTQDMLERYDCEIEIIELTPVDGEVKIPKYWDLVSFSGRRCSHLVGICMCGRNHAAADSRIISLLNHYRTRIV